MNVPDLIEKIDRLRIDAELVSNALELLRQDEDIDGQEYLLRRARGSVDSAVSDLRGACNELREVQ